MLVRFCGGYIDPERVEAVMPSTRNGYILVTRGGNSICFDADTGELSEELVRAGLLKKEAAGDGA